MTSGPRVLLRSSCGEPGKPLTTDPRRPRRPRRMAYHPASQTALGSGEPEGYSVSEEFARGEAREQPSL